MSCPSKASTMAMIAACTSRMDELESSGVDPEVSLLRVWDCYETAWLDLDRPCVDPRDRLFENRLRTIAAKGRKETTCAH